MNPYNQITAVVTGGASGIGLALAQALAQRGARVAVADLDGEKAQAVASGLDGAARGYACDVSSSAQVASLAAAVASDFGSVNLVFANAGVAVGGTVADTKPTEFNWMFEVNVGGTFATMQAFMPSLMAAAKAGQFAHFVTTGSENSLGLPPGSPSSIYTATKHALLGLTDALRRDLAPAGVGVSIFCPGLVNTNIWDSRRIRPERHGGAAQVPAEMAQRIRQAMAGAQAPQTTAQLCLEGVERNDFMIITDPKIRDLWAQRQTDINNALDLLDVRLAEKKETP